MKTNAKVRLRPEVVKLLEIYNHNGRAGKSDGKFNR